MDRLDLETPRFTQAQVLTLVPGLSAKTLQNWLARGVIQHPDIAPGRQAKRLWSGIVVLALDFMVAISDLGIGPAVAAELAETYVQHAMDLHQNYPVEVGPDGVLEWIEQWCHQDLYSRGHIYKLDGKHLLSIDNRNVHEVRMFLPHVYIGVEVDRMILIMLNRIYLQIAGKTRENTGVVLGDRISPPTGK